MITSSTLWLDMSLGILAAGLILGALLALTEFDRRRDRAAEREFHVPQHRAEEPLPPAHVEVIRVGPLTLVPEIQERTEEMPRVETPVVHVEVAEEPTVEGAIGTMAADESPEMADAAWQHEWEKRWTALQVGWAQRPEWLAQFGDASLQLPEYRRLVLEHTQDATSADELAAMVAGAKAGASR